MGSTPGGRNLTETAERVAASDDVVRIRGTALRGAFRYVKEKRLPGGVDAVLAELEGEDRKPFERQIVASDWYPYGAYATLLAAIDRLAGTGDFGLAPEIGRFAIDRDLRGIVKIALVFATPSALISRGFQAWGNILWRRYCNRGRVSLVRHQAETASMSLEGFPEIHRAHCRLMEGWLEGLFVAVGASEITVTQDSCVHLGGPRCEFTGRWTTL